MKYKCIIFDCDGVLVDSEAISAKVFQQMIMKMGFQIDFDLVLKQITGTSMASNLKFFTEFTGKELPANFEMKYRKRSFEMFKSELKPINGVRDVLDSLNVPLGVASSGPSNKISLNLSTTGLIDFFGDKIFSCYDIGSWKPNPDIYLHAAKKLGFNPNDCAVIEDSKTGVMAAVSGGFDTFAFTDIENKEAFEKLGAKVFHKMKDLSKILGL